jgi:four helix bundle protein
MAVQSYRELLVWQKAMDLVTLVYDTSKAFPVDERFGLTSQIRRAAVSIPSNIAEGQGRMSTAEFIHHLSYSRGSTMELQTQAEIATRLQFIDRSKSERILTACDEIGRMLNGLISSLERRG